MIILIFKTSIANTRDVDSISEELTKLVGRNNWTVDIGDEDKVLRIQAETDVTNMLTHLLAKRGFTCEILK